MKQVIWPSGWKNVLARLHRQNVCVRARSDTPTLLVQTKDADVKLHRARKRLCCDNFNKRAGLGQMVQVAGYILMRFHSSLVGCEKMKTVG